MVEKLRVGSLFSGIGGLDLGLERAGMEVIWQVEQDAYCNKVLARHWPHVKRYGDIKTIDFTRVERPDLICGGFPCQPYSRIGKRKGSDSEQNLWPETIRAIRESRSRWVLLENVPALLEFEYFGSILQDLAESGFDVEWSCLPTTAFGSPQLRERLWIVAHPGSKRLEGIFQVGPTETPIRRGDREHAPMDRVSLLRELRLYDPYDSCSRMRVPTDRGVVERPICGQGWWEVGPRIFRVASGFPRRVDRLKCLGNAVVPQVAEWIGRRIMEAVNA